MSWKAGLEWSEDWMLGLTRDFLEIASIWNCMVDMQHWLLWEFQVRDGCFLEY